MATYAGRYSEDLQDRYGNGFGNATVAVQTLAGGAVTLYADREKTAYVPSLGLESNEVKADDKGNLRFFANPGNYQIVVTPSSGSALSALPVSVFPDPLELDGGIVGQLLMRAASPTGGVSWVDKPTVWADDPQFADINAAISALNAGVGGTLVLSAKTYLSTAISAAKPMRIEGAGLGNTIIQPTASRATLFSADSDDVVLENLTLNSDGLITSYLLQMGIGYSNLRAVGCGFTDPVGTAGALGFEIRQGCSGVRFVDCLFDGTRECRIRQNATDVWVTRCEFTNWWDRAIIVLADATYAPSDVWLLFNKIHTVDPVSTGPRQPINLEGHASNSIRHVKVIGNDIEGSDAPWISAATANGGTADQISLHRVEDFVVANNDSRDGGDVGITVSLFCKRGIIANNICNNNDTCGIALGSPSAGISHVTVSGNVCMNNGQDRNADHAAAPLLLGGIYLKEVLHSSITGNILTDDQTVPTQRYGLTYDGCTNVWIGEDNIYDGNTLGEVGIAGTNTRVNRIFTAETTWDPPSFASGITIITTMTVAGVVAGDFVETVSFSSIGGTNVVLTADVQGANTVRIKLTNLTTVSQDLASGTLRVRVRKAL